MKRTLFSFVSLIILVVSLSAQANKAVSSNQKMALEAAPPAVQASITKAINEATQMKEEVWLSNPNFNSHFTKNTISLSPRGNDHCYAKLTKKNW